MYVFVRKDLPLPYAAVQACHAAIEVARNNLIPNHFDHPHLVLLGIQNLAKLQVCQNYLDSIGVQYKSFYEVDLDGELTAIATEPVPENLRKHFRKFQLLKDRGQP